MKNKFDLTTPVLYLVFNRLDTVKKTFLEIQKAKPKQVFIAADGPRTKEERKKTDAVRKYILDNINWKCKVEILFRNKNLGCKYAVAGAIDWFFENVEQGIILEDDCLPDQSFFRFCQEMLERYRDDTRIMHISGTNIQGRTKISESYFFSETYNVWGWATWKRAWKYYDVEMKKWGKIDKKKFIRGLGYGFLNKIKSERLYKLTWNGKIDTWDYQWDFACHLDSGLCIVPKMNLITNIGFGGDGTHTTNDNAKQMMLKRYKIIYPIRENKNIISSKRYLYSTIKFFRGNIIKRILKKIKNKLFSHL